MFLTCFFSSTNLTELAKAVKMLAALSNTQQDGNNLLDAARALAGATSKLLDASHPDNIEVQYLHVHVHVIIVC